MSVSFWVTAVGSLSCLVWLFYKGYIALDLLPAVVSMWAVAILFIGLIELWGRK